jgi:hypothetical protein
VTFDETAPCPRGVFECAGDKEMEESIFVDKGLQGVDGDEDEPLLPSTSSPESVSAFTLEAEALQATTSSTAVVEASRVEGEIVFKSGAPSHIQKAHPPQQIIGNLNKRVTHSSRYPSEANEVRYLRASSQVHEGPNEEVKHGGAQASVYSDELRCLAWFT